MAVSSTPIAEDDTVFADKRANDNGSLSPRQAIGNSASGHARPL
jgi:hypothetical protein